MNFSCWYFLFFCLVFEIFENKYSEEASKLQYTCTLSKILFIWSARYSHRYWSMGMCAYAFDIFVSSKYTGLFNFVEWQLPMSTYINIIWCDTHLPNKSKKCTSTWSMKHTRVYFDRKGGVNHIWLNDSKRYIIFHICTVHTPYTGDTYWFFELNL